ncbi:Hypothetical_protein [Hexamita inflata]|uniref:Hypothetical_protein n=1 Tax=Hexamita inflata TaxID=28002 RepID=A0AA86U2D1_9EUKA|nr:Hypothetical protein HINF_LOCUS25394 [Hexamita inflata]
MDLSRKQIILIQLDKSFEAKKRRTSELIRDYPAAYDCQNEGQISTRSSKNTQQYGPNGQYGYGASTQRKQTKRGCGEKNKQLHCFIIIESKLNILLECGLKIFHLTTYFTQSFSKLLILPSYCTMSIVPIIQKLIICSNL